MITERVYNGRDNLAEWLLTTDGQVVDDLGAVTNMILVVGGVEYDAATLGNGIIWWTDTMTWEGQTVDVLKMKLGKFNIPAGGYTYCRLRTYDPVNTDGVTWSDDITLDVRDT